MSKLSDNCSPNYSSQPLPSAVRAIDKFTVELWFGDLRPSIACFPCLFRAPHPLNEPHWILLLLLLVELLLLLLLLLLHDNDHYHPGRGNPDDDVDGRQDDAHP
jgi:hypothetical protein